MNGRWLGKINERLGLLRMSNGAVIIANDIDQIKYTRMARVAARLITRNLKIPVALITDTEVDYPEFEKIIVVARNNNNARTTVMGTTHQTMNWFNLSRTDVYDLTPWGRTLVVDADLFIMTDALKSHMSADFDFGMVKDIHIPTDGKTKVAKIAKSQVDHMWATAMIFNKSTQAESIFAMAKHVIKHYKTYAKIYDFDAIHIRNDYAFSIACHLLGGYGMYNFGLKNYAMTNVYFNNTVKEIRPNGNFVVEYNKLTKGESKKYVQQLGLSDIHILNKLSLMDHIGELEKL